MVEIVEVAEVAKKKVIIKFTKRSACGSCRASQICGKASQNLNIDRQSFNLKPGDKVKIEIDERRSLLACFLTFLLPAAIFVFSLIILRDRGEGRSFLLATFIICAYYGLMKIYINRHQKKFNIKIIAKIA